MTTNRLEAFSDGVLAIIITIMVLEFHIPEGATFQALLPLLPKFLSYLFSFIYVGIYWNNHHHLFQAIQLVNGRILLANLNLLFWISILPFATAWMGEHHFGGNTVVLYGLVLFLSAISFYLLEKAAIQYEGPESKLSIAVRGHHKERISLLAYAAGIVLAFYYPIISLILFYLTALIWFIPDKRIEKILIS
ncbi:MAG: DUF1211 domain-containing protein [Bacteroidetes Order II. Incertae sedis bacterium]|nr:DUF1211 domain-containing protein [Bacteroidetes Order II. bacterium]